MYKLFATIYKDWLLLWRDKVGLIILFILPMCLVTFISLTHYRQDENKESLNILLLQKEKGDMGKAIAKGLRNIKQYKITAVNGKKITEREAKRLVAKGDYQALIIIPANIGTLMRKYLVGLTFGNTNQKKLAYPTVKLLLDPAMPSALSSHIKLSMRLLLDHVSNEAYLNLIANKFNLRVRKIRPDLIKLHSQAVSLNTNNKKPNAVEQYVPAWALFGMFFIVMPLAGMMVRERAQGVSQRLRVAPVSQFTLIVGKLIAFVVLNMIQMYLMLSVGVYILPPLGLPTLPLYDHIGLVTITGICASFAATGFGILIGAWARTYQQATIVGPFIIVIFAAIGGILVPYYMLPEALQYISNLSPLHWAQNAFMDIFVRNADLHQLIPSLIKLIIFAVVMIILSLLGLLHVGNQRRLDE